jgi:hypothetical protein
MVRNQAPEKEGIETDGAVASKGAASAADPSVELMRLINSFQVSQALHVAVRYAEGSPDRFGALAGELVAAVPAVVALRRAAQALPALLERQTGRGRGFDVLG